MDDIADRVQLLLKLTDPVRHVLSTGKAVVLLPLQSGLQGTAIQESLSCIICKGNFIAI